MATPTDKTKTPHPMAVLEEAKLQRDAQTRKENKDLDRQQRDAQQLKDLDDGVGFSSDKILARYYDTTRKTIWSWARDENNPFPQPKKVGANMTRWNNAEIKAHRTNESIRRLYG
jgi:predicted DNA-binding transcriptional regulator AlpA